MEGPLPVSGTSFGDIPDSLLTRENFPSPGDVVVLALPPATCSSGDIASSTSLRSFVTEIASTTTSQAVRHPSSPHQDAKSRHLCVVVSAHDFDRTHAVFKLLCTRTYGGCANYREVPDFRALSSLPGVKAGVTVGRMHLPLPTTADKSEQYNHLGELHVDVENQEDWMRRGLLWTVEEGTKMLLSAERRWVVARVVVVKYPYNSRVYQIGFPSPRVSLSLGALEEVLSYARTLHMPNEPWLHHIGEYDLDYDPDDQGRHGRYLGGPYSTVWLARIGRPNAAGRGQTSARGGPSTGGQYGRRAQGGGVEDVNDAEEGHAEEDSHTSPSLISPRAPLVIDAIPSSSITPSSERFAWGDIPLELGDDEDHVSPSPSLSSRSSLSSLSPPSSPSPLTRNLGPPTSLPPSSAFDETTTPSAAEEAASTLNPPFIDIDYSIGAQGRQKEESKTDKTLQEGAQGARGAGSVAEERAGGLDEKDGRVDSRRTGAGVGQPQKLTAAALRSSGLEQPQAEKTRLILGWVAGRGRAV